MDELFYYEQYSGTTGFSEYELEMLAELRYLWINYLPVSHELYNQKLEEFFIFQKNPPDEPKETIEPFDDIKNPEVRRYYQEHITRLLANAQKSNDSFQAQLRLVNSQKDMMLGRKPKRPPNLHSPTVPNYKKPEEKPMTIEDFARYEWLFPYIEETLPKAKKYYFSQLINYLNKNAIDENLWSQIQISFPLLLKNFLELFEHHAHPCSPEEILFFEASLKRMNLITTRLDRGERLRAFDIFWLRGFFDNRSSNNLGFSSALELDYFLQGMYLKKYEKDAYQHILQKLEEIYMRI